MDLRNLYKMLDYFRAKGASQKSILSLQEEIVAKELSLEQCKLDWYEVYCEEQRRGNGGGSSENADTQTFSMTDNRVQSTKWTESERRAYFTALAEWEEKNGKLERLSKRK